MLRNDGRRTELEEGRKEGGYYWEKEGRKDLHSGVAEVGVKPAAEPVLLVPLRLPVPARGRHHRYHH